MKKKLRDRVKAAARCLVINGFLPLSVLTLISSPPASAGNFAISPIRLDFDAATKNSSITITNTDTANLKVQVQLYEWVQDQNGKDSYIPSEDLLYFPRLATIAGGSNQIVRVGLRVSPNEVTEKSYRLFVEELPDQKTRTGSQLTVALRFGVPLFIKPDKEEPRGKIESISLDKGQLHVVVSNNGNVHFMITSISVVSADLYSAEMSGWYLLPAAKREYLFKVPPERCAKLKKIDVIVKTDRLMLERSLDTVPPMCSSK